MKGAVIVLLTSACLLGLLFLMGYITSLLWNYALVPQGLKEINWITGTAVNVLGSIVFGGTILKAKRSQ